MIVTGQRQLYQLKLAFDEAGRAGLPKALDRGGDEAGEVIAREVRGNTDDYMPRGYETVFAQTLITKVTQRQGLDRRITVSGRARGARGHDRHVSQLEDGELKHPVFGRRRRLKSGRYKNNPWSTQRVRPHWFSEPGLHAVPRAIRKIDEAVGTVTHKIEASVL